MSQRDRANWPARKANIKTDRSDAMNCDVNRQVGQTHFGVCMHAQRLIGRASTEPTAEKHDQQTATQTAPLWHAR
eukprot:9922940-Alexandrium_andersonii.AAC.1